MNLLEGDMAMTFTVKSPRCLRVLALGLPECRAGLFTRRMFTRRGSWRAFG